MKFKFKLNRIFFVAFLFAATNGLSYDPTQAVNQNWESDYSEELTDRKIYDTNIDTTDIVEAGADKTALKTWEDNRAGVVEEGETYFVNMAYSSCTEPADYVCPSLKSDLAAEGYRTRINSIDLKNGKISCSVYSPLENSTTPLTIKSETPLFAKTFVNQACVEKYSTASNKDDSDEVKELIAGNKDFLEELKQQEYKYTVDYKQNGEDEFLDLADTVDSLVSFNANVFDFEQTLLTRDLKTRSGFTTLPNETVVTKFQDTFKNFMSLFGIGSYDEGVFEENIENQAKIRDASSAIANSSFFMLLDFWLKANDAIVLLAQGLTLLFVGYNVIFTWVSPTLTNKMQQNDSRENHHYRLVYGFLMIIMFWAGDVEKLNIEYQSKSEDVIKTELIVQQTNIQALIQFLYSETNHWADVFAEIGIKAFLNSLNSSTGLFDEAQIAAIASEKIVLQKESEALAVIEKAMCFENYEVKLITDKLASYRTMTLSKREGNESTILSYVGLGENKVGSLKANPFPKSEREANAIMVYDKEGQKFSNSSPYNSAWSKYDSGVVKQTALHKFRIADYSPLSLSGCYYNKKKMIDNKSRMEDIEQQFAKFSSPTQKSAKVEYLKVINEIQWSLYAKQGYLSIAYLPVTQMLLSNIGMIDDELSAIKNISENNEDDVVSDFATGTMKILAEDLPILVMFNGIGVAKVIHVIKEPLIDFMVDKLSLMTGGVGKAVVGAKNLLDKLSMGEDENQIDILDLRISSFLIKTIFGSIVSAIILTSTIFMFVMLFIEKLFAFISSMFLLIYVFSTNQQERVSGAIAKIIAISFKTVLIVICVFLSMFSLFLVSYFEILSLNTFFSSMDSIENAAWSYSFSTIDFSNILSLIKLFFGKYFLYGVVSVAFMLLKIVLAINIIWKMPGYMYELLYEKIHSAADDVGASLQSANEKIMRV
uniref:hypothetical protein n=1 Tax=Aliarcobacter sp. TaxID=2321116 RepID=UPI0040473211